jgi:hypothetical protein
MDSLNCHMGLPSWTLLRPAGGPPLKQPFGCGRLLPIWTPHAIRLWAKRRRMDRESGWNQPEEHLSPPGRAGTRLDARVTCRGDDKLNLPTEIRKVPRLSFLSDATAMSPRRRRKKWYHGMVI